MSDLYKCGPLHEETCLLFEREMMSVMLENVCVPQIAGLKMEGEGKRGRFGTRPRNSEVECLHLIPQDVLATEQSQGERGRVTRNS